MAPHEDALDTKERAVRNLLDRLALATERRRPLKAWVPVPILLPGEKTSTRLEPATSPVRPGAADRGARRRAGRGDLDRLRLGATSPATAAWSWSPVTTRSVITPRGRAAGPGGLAGPGRLRLRRPDRLAGRGAWTPPWPAAPAPTLISDSGDNPTAGGTGDVSWTLGELIADERITAGGAPGRSSPRFMTRPRWTGCVAAGVGAEVTVAGRAAWSTPGPRRPGRADRHGGPHRHRRSGRRRRGRAARSAICT